MGTTITTRTDLMDHVAAACGNHSAFEQSQIEENLFFRTDRPAWGDDWTDWLETALPDACDEVIAVNAGQPEPPPSDDEDDDESAPVDHAARLARAAARIDSDDPMIAGDAYSHWCAGCGGEEQPSWWTPDTRTVQEAAQEAIESAAFAGEGEARATVRSYPRALAEAMAGILRDRGMDASVAPDCKDSSQFWLYAYEG